THRDHLQTVYNAHMLHSSSTDPFKLALYKLMGRLEPSRRNVPQVTATTEDWLWFQLAMVGFRLVYLGRKLTRCRLTKMRKVVFAPSLKFCSVMVNVTLMDPLVNVAGGSGPAYYSFVDSLSG